MYPFYQYFEAVGEWDVQQLTADIKNVFEKTGCDWDTWSRYGKVSATKYANNPIYQYGDLNLTCNTNLCTTLEDQLWLYSLRQFREDKEVSPSDLHTLNPAFKETYLEKYYNALVNELGPVYLRLHNRCNRTGLYLHKDTNPYKEALFKYHLVLWTNPGHLIFWSDQDISFHKGVEPHHNFIPYDFHTKFFPVNNKCIKLAAGYYVHGVANMGIGHNKSDLPESRCHLVASPIIPSNKYSQYMK